MKKKRLAVITIIVLILFIFSSFYYLKKDNGKCDSKEDCVKVQTTCCPCNMGGNEKCVHKSEVESYEEKLKSCAVKDFFCPAVYNCYIHDCDCINGNCTDIKIKE